MILTLAREGGRDACHCRCAVVCSVPKRATRVADGRETAGVAMPRERDACKMRPEGEQMTGPPEVVWLEGAIAAVYALRLEA